MTEAEKELIENLAEEANQIIASNGFSEDVKEIVQAIATLKHN
ncbi:hypothetical protein [Sporolactobacillus terrae]|nr:hypothetical protein [Sporolactobacillus terrae]